MALLYIVDVPLREITAKTILNNLNENISDRRYGCWWRNSFLHQFTVKWETFYWFLEKKNIENDDCDSEIVYLYIKIAVDRKKDMLKRESVYCLNLMCEGKTSLENDKKLNRTHKKKSTQIGKNYKKKQKITLRMSQEWYSEKMKMRINKKS